MRARKAKPRPHRGSEADNRVSTGHCGLGSASTRIFPCPGAVLPKPGFPIHPPDGEKSRLARCRLSAIVVDTKRPRAAHTPRRSETEPR